MGYCRNCGKELGKEAGYCSWCGTPSEAYASQMKSRLAEDVPSMGFNVLSLFFPLVGLILYLVWKDETPIKAKEIGKYAIIGAAAYTGIAVIGIILMLIMFMGGLFFMF